jgi:uncharacterized small protein (DUF1192 family)
MPVEKTAAPLPERELIVALFHGVVRAIRPHVDSWDDLKMMLMNGAALAVQEFATKQGSSLAETAEALKVDVTTLRRNLPPPPGRDTLSDQIVREVYRLLDKEGRATLGELETLLSASAPVIAARRVQPRLSVADVVLDMAAEGQLARIEREQLPTQYSLPAGAPMLQQMGRSRQDWLQGLGYAMSIAFDAAFRQANEINSEAFNHKVKRAVAAGEMPPPPEKERVPWFFMQRPSHLSTHELNERVAAAVRQVIEQIEAERSPDDEGELSQFTLAMNHSLQGVGP